MTTSGMRIAMEIDDWNRLRQENADLRALVKELEQALNIWADAVDDSELTDLIERARRACR